MSFLEALFSTQNSESPQQPSVQTGTRSISLSTINLRDLARSVTVRTSGSLRGTNLRAEEEDEWEDDEDDEYSPEDQKDLVSGHQCFPPVKEPQKEGEELLRSGDFGRVGIKIRSRVNNRNLVKSVLNRATHPIPNFNKEDLLSVCVSFPYQNHELNWFYPPEPCSKHQWNCSCNLRGQHVHCPIFRWHINLIYRIRIMSNFLLTDSSFYYTCAQGILGDKSTMNNFRLTHFWAPFRLQAAYLRHEGAPERKCHRFFKTFPY